MTITDKVTRATTAITAIKAAYASAFWYITDKITIDAALDALGLIYTDLEILVLDESTKLASLVNQVTLSTDIILSLNILSTPLDTTDSFRDKYGSMNLAYIGNFIEANIAAIEVMPLAAYTTTLEMTDDIAIKTTQANAEVTMYDNLLISSNQFSKVILDLNIGIASNSTLASSDALLVSALDATKSPLLQTYNPSFISTVEKVIPILGLSVNDRFSALMSQLVADLGADASLQATAIDLASKVMAFT